MKTNNVIQFPVTWQQLVQQANKFHRDKKWQKAIEYYNAAMRKHPDCWSSSYSILVAAKDLCQSMLTPKEVWYEDCEEEEY